MACKVKLKHFGHYSKLIGSRPYLGADKTTVQLSLQTINQEMNSYRKIT